jgi:hypothetical protein
MIVRLRQVSFFSGGQQYNTIIVITGLGSFVPSSARDKSSLSSCKTIMAPTETTEATDDTAVEAMEVEETTAAAAAETEEDLGNLVELMDDASSKPAAGQIPVLQQLLTDTQYYGSKATSLKERAIYDLTRAYCNTHQYKAVVPLLKETHFFSQVTKAKCARVVRAVLDMVCLEAPQQLEMQADICKNIIEWCRREKRTFLRQRVEAKLAAIWVDEKDFGAALLIVDDLLPELKKLDDKQLLVEIHLLEAKVHFGLRNTPKSKAALTASRTCANSIYVSPSLQATIDNMSGILHCEEEDYDTAHSYFLEAFEQLDQLNDTERAVPCLKYMMLCRILDSLTKALNLSAKGGVGELHVRCVAVAVVVVFFFWSLNCLPPCPLTLLHPSLATLVRSQIQQGRCGHFRYDFLPSGGQVRRSRH